MRDFASVFSCLPTAAADAPGRVNLIGEHTDYNGGFVLPTAIPQRTQVELASRADRLVRVCSEVEADAPPREYALGGETAGQAWLDYIQGVTSLLAAGDHRLAGLDIRITSRVPVGS